MSKEEWIQEQICRQISSLKYCILPLMVTKLADMVAIKAFVILASEIDSFLSIQRLWLNAE